jgi:hypothetical protein
MSPMPLDKLLATPLLADASAATGSGGTGSTTTPSAAAPALVQAMGAYPTTSLGFDPAITAQASNAPT